MGVLKHDRKRGRPLWRSARGLSNLALHAPLTTRTPFRICSISKQFACALVMREVAAGRIALDAHPSHYLPWTKTTQPFSLADGVAVSGRAPESMFALGSQNLYCNANFEMLGQVLEKVRGAPYAELLSQHILLPRRMHDSHPASPASLP